MGIKGLWTLLGPYCERKPLHEIRGETVAIDLSGWVCDSQNVADNGAQPRLYLRNLYFRTSYLLLGGIMPVFVLEGEAPVMKQDVMAARNLLQFRGNPAKAANGHNTKKPNTKRKRFRSVLSQCEKLLSSMGLQCVTARGEAEAMCSHLNAVGAVSAIISQDSDCFAYGAKKVYRNFSVSNSSCNSANSGSVDVYDLDKINQTLDIGRQKMVALALLCGCDYNGGGVEGVGYSNAVSFIMRHSENDIIDRLLSWTSNPLMFHELSCKVEDSTLCTGCGHGGNIRVHSRSGCLKCKTDSGCDQSKYREWRLHIRTELSIRSKSLNHDKAFPDPLVMEEFLTAKDKTPEDFDPKWCKPDLIKFVKLMSKSLSWTESYCVEKFLPLLTGWQLLYGAGDLSLVPDFIKKKRTPKGIPCYEVMWTDPGGHYKGLVSDDQIESEEDLQNLWTTVERQDLMEAAYPDIVQTFLLSKAKKSKRKPKSMIENEGGCIKERSKSRRKVIVNDLNDLLLDINSSLKNLSIDVKSRENTVKKPSKRKGDILEVSFKTKAKKGFKVKEKKTIRSQKKIDAYLVKENSEIDEKYSDIENVPSTINVRSKIIHKNVYQSPLLSRKAHLFDDLDSTADLVNNLSLLDEKLDDSADISMIIDGILERKNCINIENVLKCDLPLKSIQNFSTPVKSSNRERLSTLFHNRSRVRRVSYFFDDLQCDNDAFERSIDLKNAPDLFNDPEDLDKTVEYIYNGSGSEIIAPDNFKEVSNVASKKSNLQSLEERLFGTGSSKVNNSVVSSEKNSPVKNIIHNIDSPIIYTPLADRIRKLKKCL